MHSKKIEFPIILSYSMQDIGNALGLITNTIEQIEQKHNLQDNEDDILRLFELKYELSRIHHNAIQLSHLYELDYNNYQVRLDDQCVYDFLDEVKIKTEVLCESKSISIKIACDENLIWPFDSHILSSAISNILCNSIRYAKSNIILSGIENDGFLQLRIEDDSSGYPKRLHIDKEQCEQGLNLDRSSIALGLYHTLKIASLHKHDGKEGYIEINNNSSLGGGQYSVYLP